MGFVGDKTIQSPLILTFLSGESHGQRSLAGYCPCGCRAGYNWVRARVHTHTHTQACNLNIFVIFLLQMEKEVSWEFNDLLKVSNLMEMERLSHLWLFSHRMPHWKHPHQTHHTISCSPIQPALSCQAAIQHSTAQHSTAQPMSCRTRHAVMYFKDTMSCPVPCQLSNRIIHQSSFFVLPYVPSKAYHCT